MPWKEMRQSILLEENMLSIGLFNPNTMISNMKSIRLKERTKNWNKRTVKSKKSTWTRSSSIRQLWRNSANKLKALRLKYNLIAALQIRNKMIMNCYWKTWKPSKVRLTILKIKTRNLKESLNNKKIFSPRSRRPSLTYLKERNRLNNRTKKKLKL